VRLIKQRFIKCSLFQDLEKSLKNFTFQNMSEIVDRIDIIQRSS